MEGSYMFDDELIKQIEKFIIPQCANSVTSAKDHLPHFTARKIHLYSSNSNSNNGLHNCYRQDEISNGNFKIKQIKK